MVDIALEQYEASTPRRLDYGEWVTPYIQPGEVFRSEEDKRRVSSARCARVSYLNHDRSEPDIDGDLGLFTKLAAARPMEARLSRASAQLDSCGGIVQRVLSRSTSASSIARNALSAEPGAAREGINA